MSVSDTSHHYTTSSIKHCPDIHIDGPNSLREESKEQPSAAWQPSNSNNVYIPLIGDLDDNQQHVANDKFRFTSEPKSSKTAPTTENYGSSKEVTTSLGYKIIFRRLLSSYSLLTKIQSWQKFLDTSRMKTPTSANLIKRRFLENSQHFQGNYLCIFAILFIYCILTSPLLLLAIALICGALYFVTVVNHRQSIVSHQQNHNNSKQARLTIFGIEPTLQQQYTIITLFALPLLWVSGAPSAIFWVLGATFFVVGLHSGVFAIEIDNAEQHQRHVAPPMSNATRLHHNLCELDQRAEEAMNKGQLLEI